MHRKIEGPTVPRRMRTTGPPLVRVAWVAVWAAVEARTSACRNRPTFDFEVFLLYFALLGLGLTKQWDSGLVLTV